MSPKTKHHSTQKKGYEFANSTAFVRSEGAKKPKQRLSCGVMSKVCNSEEIGSISLKKLDKKKKALDELWRKNPLILQMLYYYFNNKIQ